MRLSVLWFWFCWGSKVRLCFCYLILLSEKIKHLTKSSTHRPSTQTFLPSLTFSSLKSLKQNHPLWPNIKHAPWKTLHKLSLSLSLSLHHYQNPTINLPLPKKLQPDMLISFQHLYYCYNESVSTLILLFMSTGMEHSLVFMLCFGQVNPFWRVPTGLRDGPIFLTRLIWVGYVSKLILNSVFVVFVHMILNLLLDCRMARVN